MGAERFDYRPGDGQSVEGSGATAYFVEEYKAGGRSSVDNGGDFTHFHEEGGTSTGKVIGCADAGEDAVHQRQAGVCDRYEATHLGHQHDQRGLAKVGGFAAHVGASNEKQKWRGIAEVEIVGNEAVAGLG